MSGRFVLKTVEKLRFKWAFRSRKKLQFLTAQLKEIEGSEIRSHHQNRLMHKEYLWRSTSERAWGWAGYTLTTRPSWPSLACRISTVPPVYPQWAHPFVTVFVSSFQHVDTGNSYLCGYLKIKGLTEVSTHHMSLNQEVGGPHHSPIELRTGNSNNVLSIVMSKA